MIDLRAEARPEPGGGFRPAVRFFVGRGPGILVWTGDETYHTQRYALTDATAQIEYVVRRLFASPGHSPTEPARPSPAGKVVGRGGMPRPSPVRRIVWPTTSAD